MTIIEWCGSRHESPSGATVYCKACQPAVTPTKEVGTRTKDEAEARRGERGVPCSGDDAAPVATAGAGVLVVDEVALGGRGDLSGDGGGDGEEGVHCGRVR